jgi:hypothetical protein
MPPSARIYTPLRINPTVALELWSVRPQAAGPILGDH